MTMLLDPTPPKPLSLPRTTASAGAELRALLTSGGLALPMPGAGNTRERWSALASLGRRDLVLARLAEGHTDAVAILAEAGRTPLDGALYGVWAARSEGTGALLDDGRLSGTVRFCSGVDVLDRALVVAGDRLVDLDLGHGGVQRNAEAWQAIGMDASDSGDVTFHDVLVAGQDIVGPPGWYVSRPGFAFGGAGVAAVWLGGCAGVVDSVLTYLRERGRTDDHQLAHVGAMHAALSSAEALLAQAAEAVDNQPADPAMLADICRAGVERAACEILERAPKVTGPTPMVRDRQFAQRLADLLVYVRQHHAERDLAGLGRRVLAMDQGR
jgi:alkylation response protein AidB-like acyl-CoA dehydrogenase